MKEHLSDFTIGFINGPTYVKEGWPLYQDRQAMMDRLKKPCSELLYGSICGAINFLDSQQKNK